MTTYQIVYGYNSSRVTVDEPTTDFQMLVDILIDELEENGYTGCFIAYEDTIEGGGEVPADEYICGGNHCLLLHHGGNFMIEELKGEAA